ncbi:18987_t:CDS:2, partial [Gigaspora margarita]
IDHCLEIFDNLFDQDNTIKIIIMYDVVYSYCIDKFVHKVRTDLKYTNVIQPFVKTDFNISQGLKDMDNPQLNGRYYKLFEGTLHDFLYWRRKFNTGKRLND